MTPPPLRDRGGFEREKRVKVALSLFSFPCRNGEEEEEKIGRSQCSNKNIARLAMKKTNSRPDQLQPVKIPGDRGGGKSTWTFDQRRFLPHAELEMLISYLCISFDFLGSTKSFDWLLRSRANERKSNRADYYDCPLIWIERVKKVGRLGCRSGTRRAINSRISDGWKGQTAAL